MSFCSLRFDRGLLERRDVNRSHRHPRALPNLAAGRRTDGNSALATATDGRVKTLSKGSTREVTVIAQRRGGGAMFSPREEPLASKKSNLLLQSRALIMSGQE